MTKSEEILFEIAVHFCHSEQARAAMIRTSVNLSAGAAWNPFQASRLEMSTYLTPPIAGRDRGVKKSIIISFLAFQLDFAFAAVKSVGYVS